MLFNSGTLSVCVCVCVWWGVRGDGDLSLPRRNVVLAEISHFAVNLIALSVKWAYLWGIGAPNKQTDVDTRIILTEVSAQTITTKMANTSHQFDTIYLRLYRKDDRKHLTI